MNVSRLLLASLGYFYPSIISDVKTFRLDLLSIEMYRSCLSECQKNFINIGRSEGKETLKE